MDVRPILAEIKEAFPNRFEIVSQQDEFGAGFRGVLTLPNREKITVEVLSNFQDVLQNELTDSNILPQIKRITRERFLADKIQCIAERSEARDLILSWLKEGG